MATLAELDARVDANPDAARGIAAAYEVLLGGVPSIDGFVFLIDNAKATNFGSNNPNITFNQENIFINLTNALVQGNPAAKTAFQELTAGAATLGDKLGAIYDAYVPSDEQSAEGRAFFTRAEAQAFYTNVAAERGVAGVDGAAIVGLASLLKILVTEDKALGDDVNDLMAAIGDGSAVLPTNGAVFTPIETADGTHFDADDKDLTPVGVTLTEGVDIVSGNIFNAPRGFTPGGTDQVNTLNDDDVLTGTGTNPTLNFSFVNNADTPLDVDINPTLKGIETVNVNIRLDGPGYLDFQDSTGVKNINVDGVDGTLFQAYNIQDAGGAAGINLSVNNSNDEDSRVGFLFVDGALQGAADVANLTVNNVSLGDISVDGGGKGGGSQGFETLNLKSTGSANSVGFITAEDLQTVKISGDKALSLGESEEVLRGGDQVEAFHREAGFRDVAGSLSTIDASALGAALDIAVGAESTASKDGTSGTPVDISIVGTKFNDAIRMLSGIDSVKDAVDGGEGEDLIQVYNSIAKGSVTGVEHLDVRGGRDDNLAADTIKIDTSLFTGLKDVTIRNEGHQENKAGIQNVGPEILTTHLTNLSADVAKAITVQHSTTGSNGLGQNTIVAQLKADTAADTVGLKIVDQSDGEDRGININPRFNVTLETAGIENITLSDADSESNTVKLGDGGTATDVNGGDNLSDITGTVSITGGSVGTFFNLDSDGGGIYGYNTNGADGTSLVDGTGAPVAGAVRAAGTVDTRFSALKIDATDNLSDVVVRVDTVRNAKGEDQIGQGQTILMGKGNDTVVFDYINNKTAGLTVLDVVKGGEGSDTLAIDGQGARIELGASEWTNVSGFETIRLIGNGQVDQNGLGQLNAYNLVLTNELLAANGAASGAGRSINIVNDSDPFNDGKAGVAGTAGVANESGVTIDATALSAANTFAYDGEEGPARSLDRFILSDATISGIARIDGGAAWNVGDTSGSNAANGDIIEVRNKAVIAAGDLANIKNVSTFQFTNDSAVAQTSNLTLDSATLDNLVNSTKLAETASKETFTISALGSQTVPGAATVVNVDATQVDFTKFNLVIDTTAGAAGSNATVNVTGTGPVTFTGGAANETFTGTAGNDTLTGGAGADQFRFVASGDGIDVIKDFGTGADHIAFSEGLINFAGVAGSAAGTELVAADYQNQNTVVNIAAADTLKVVELQNAQTAAEITTGVGGAANAVVAVFNSTTNMAELWYDNNWSDVAGRVQLATLEGFANVGAMTAALDQTDFMQFI